MSILNYTTTVAPTKTAGEIQSVLAKHGAKQVSVTYLAGQVFGITFMIDTEFGERMFDLPVNAGGVFEALRRTAPPRYQTREQAQRVAWRILKDWVEAQMAIIEARMVTLDEVFMPYMVTDSGKTLTQTYRDSEQMRIQIGGAPKELN